MWIRSLVLAAVVAACAGCLVKETESVLYLEDDGSVTWTVVERNVRSDETAPLDRAREEREYLESAGRGSHPVRTALESLWPVGVESAVRRDRRPFTVVTTARFLGPDVLARELLDRMGLPGRAVLERSPGSTRLVVTVDPRATVRAEDDGASPVEPLVDAIAGLRIVLGRGAFLGAEGFRIEGDDVLVLDEEPIEALVENARDDVVVWFEWTTAP